MANINKINERIETIRASERVTKAELSAISRELLEYIAIDQSDDIDAVNRLFSALTPMNLKTAGLFFSHFLPWKFDKDAVSFGKKFKGKDAVAKAYDKIVECLADETFNVWTWAHANVRMEKAKPDYVKNITKNVSKALNDEENPAQVNDIIEAVMKGGVSVRDLINLMHDIEDQKEGEVKEAEERLAVH